MENQKSTLGDLITAETRNILEKYKVLYNLCQEIGIEENKCNDLKFLKNTLPNIIHKKKDEALNLVNKLYKIKK